jgi:hypothetical protein
MTGDELLAVEAALLLDAEWLAVLVGQRLLALGGSALSW